jgi:hypothetical protein
MMPILLSFRSPKGRSNFGLDDLEHAKDIIDLLRYDEDSAGGLMGKELLKSTKMERAYLCKRRRPKMYLEYTLFM